MTHMNAATVALDHEACHRALAARDARFDGCFFTGVTSTGIYCRPVCRVRTPGPQNCQFFRLAAQAERAGFRPCLRCRPEMAPAHGLALPGSAAWSSQDAKGILAVQAVQLLDRLWAAGPDQRGMAAVAQRLGVSERHLRRVFESQFGVSPLQYLQTRRLLCAKQLLSDTTLPVPEVARLSGFGSQRRFHAVFTSHYGLNPSSLRRRASLPAQAGLLLRLAYRPPYDERAMLAFFAARQLDGVELVVAEASMPMLARTLRLSQGGQTVTGWVQARFEPRQAQLHLRVSESLQAQLPLLLTRVRSWLDLDVDPQAINQQLHEAFPDGDGLRLPGALDGFELAVRAVLGQLVSVAAARTLAQRLVSHWGEALPTPFAGLNRLFPSPDTLARVSSDALGALGITRQKQLAIQGLAQSLLEGRLKLEPGADVAAMLALLRSLPGIGEWTAQYIAMRALAWPDALPASDAALHKALGLQGQARAAQATETVARAWQPWRSYGVIRAWAGLPQAKPARTNTDAIDTT
jgi:AraC family transcriptional regulator, regulatory protein of adaptative response / DNA-3-methyladenine glycosylase II